MAAGLRYKVIGGVAVGGVAPGGTLRIDPDDVDDHGRHAVAGAPGRILLAAALAAQLLEPLSRAAEAAADAPGESADE